MGLIRVHHSSFNVCELLFDKPHLHGELPSVSVESKGSTGSEQRGSGCSSVKSAWLEDTSPGVHMSSSPISIVAAMVRTTRVVSVARIPARDERSIVNCRRVKRNTSQDATLAKSNYKCCAISF